MDPGLDHAERAVAHGLVDDDVSYPVVDLPRQPIQLRMGRVATRGLCDRLDKSVPRDCEAGLVLDPEGEEVIQRAEAEAVGSHVEDGLLSVAEDEVIVAVAG